MSLLNEIASNYVTDEKALCLKRSNIKVALCLSGQPRLVEVGYRCAKKFLLDNYDVDTFVHTWFESNQNTLVESGGTYQVSADVDKTILDLYKPVKYKIEPQIKTFPGEEDCGKGISIFAQYSMYYSIKQANELKKQYEEENNFKYDVVIRSRFDAGLLVDLSLDEVQPEVLYAVDAINNGNRISDWFLFGSSKVMDTVSCVYDSLEELKETVRPFCGEELLWGHLQKYEVQYQKLFKGMQGYNVVLIRPGRATNNCWKSAEDILNLI